MRDQYLDAGFKEVNTPQLLDSTLWELSGHMDKFSDDMFVFDTDDKKKKVMKPMNCPCHVQIFKKRIHSYRDLPLRLLNW